MITSCRRRCHCASSLLEAALISNALCPVSIASTLSAPSSFNFREWASRACISPAYCGGESFSNSMLRFESSRKAKGAHSPDGIRILISDSRTTETGRRQMESLKEMPPLMTHIVTSSIVEHDSPSTARMMSPWIKEPSRSAGPFVVIAPTVTSPSHRSTAIPNVPPCWSRVITTSKSSSFTTLFDVAFTREGPPSSTSCASGSSVLLPGCGAPPPSSPEKEAREARAGRVASVTDMRRAASVTLSTGRLRSSSSFSRSRIAETSIASSAALTAASISALSLSSAALFAFSTAILIASSCCFRLDSCSAAAVLRISSSCCKRKASAASRAARSAASL
mmetsp:Transcript_32408/g.85034  ORF Transcript_32408/g.85034 Transcript_32408/m.85034 type:complete len:337 (+) Transcript_32408:1599-2609(+)